MLALSEAPAVTITAEAVLVVTWFAAEGGRALLVEFQHLLADGHIEGLSTEALRSRKSPPGIDSLAASVQRVLSRSTRQRSGHAPL